MPSEIIDTLIGHAKEVAMEQLNEGKELYVQLTFATEKDEGGICIYPILGIDEMFAGRFSAKKFKAAVETLYLGTACKDGEKLLGLTLAFDSYMVALDTAGMTKEEMIEAAKNTTVQGNPDRKECVMILAANEERTWVYQYGYDRIEGKVQWGEEREGDPPAFNLYPETAKMNHP